jgi:adenylate cyclase
MAEWVCGSCNGANPEGTRFCGNCGAKAPDSSPSPEERRLVTALFADISGFTPLADRLDPEELLEVIDPIVSALSSIVGRYEGFVEKFAGDALLALFGAPVSHDDDAARALLVALEMHAELDRIKAHLPPDARDLTLHVGVNSGHGIARMIGSEARTDYAVLGDAVILAQRLESAAPPGETYVSEMTVRLTDSEFAFEPVGALTLKGKAEPVPAWRLVGERDGRPQRSAMIGRESELGVVEGAVADLGSGRGGLLVITGEPGIGKSRLIEAAIDRAATLGARVHHARCISYGAGVPYWPYVDLLRRTVGLRSDEQPDATRLRLETALSDTDAREASPYFARLLGLPVADEEVSDLEPEAFRRGLHEAFRSWFRKQAVTSPVVLVLEDLHWADASTVGLTADLAGLAHEAPILILLAGRPESDENVRSIVAGAEPRRIDLGPLGQAGIAQLADAILGSGAPPPMVGVVWAGPPRATSI